MDNDITVVRIERALTDSFMVHFSRPVQLRDIGESTSWYAEIGTSDELGAYVWGLKVIEKHKEMENAQKP